MRPTHELVAEQARRSPTAIAAVDDRTRMTFAELDVHSNRLARWFRAQGIGAERIVAVCLQPGTELLAVLLGVLKAGGAYLPVDPTLPKARRAYLVADADAALVVDEAALAAHRMTIDACSDMPLATEVAPGQLAYVIYTSGSTGAPKGVMVQHNQLSTYFDWAVPTYLANGGGAPLLSPVNFDLSVTALFAPLVAGRTVRIVPAAKQVAHSLSAELTGGDFSFVKLTPAHLALLVETLPPDRLAAVTDRLVVGGEALTYQHLSEWARHAPSTLVVNEYGPTEATVGCCVHTIRAGDAADLAGPVPIGRATPGTRLAVLDERLEPVAAGEVGELFIGGAQVSRGYLGRPDLTAERFLPDPWSVGGRMYRTGDLVRQCNDGSLVYVGRRDKQINLRGHRIEPGEVEGALLQHQDVAAAVVAVSGGDGTERLVGYLVPRPGSRLDPDTVRETTVALLPEYMIPAEYLVLEALPLTRNGKVDRSALPTPESVAATSCAREARTASERHVASAAAAILRRPNVDLERRFVELGGHSLLAVLMVARLREQLGIEISAGWLLGRESLAEFAARLERAADNGRPPDLPPLVAQSSRPAAGALSIQQQEIWFLDKLVGGNRAYHVQCTIHFTGELKVELLARALQNLIDRHDILRSRFIEGPDGVQQVVDPSYELHLPVDDLSELPEDQRRPALDLLVRQEVETAGFELAALPLVRWRLVRLSATEHVVVQVAHHIVYDGWSQAVIWREIEACYIAWAGGDELRLGPLPVQYSDYVAWQRACLDGSRWLPSLTYWVDRLRDLPAPVDLPFARPRPAQQTFHGKDVQLELDHDLYEALRRLSRNEGTSLFVTMYAAFAAMLHWYTGATDLLIGSAVANRQSPATAQLIGMLANTVALRLPLQPQMSFRQLLRVARQVVSDAVTHQDAPFPEVVRMVQPPRDAGRNPIVQICFGFHDVPVPELAWPGVTGRIVEHNNQTAKFDLNLIVVPQAEQRAGVRDATGSDSLTMLWEYNTDLLDDESVERMVGHFEVVLRAVVHAPQTEIARLPLSLTWIDP